METVVGDGIIISAVAGDGIIISMEAGDGIIISAVAGDGIIISMEGGDGIIISAVAENGMIISMLSIFETRTEASREANGRPYAPMVSPRRCLLCETVLSMAEVAEKETAE
jgi:hypothetical protein